MKARVLVPLNIRIGKPEILPDNNPGFFNPNDLTEIEELVFGENYKGNNIWCKLTDGSHVWSGGVLGNAMNINELLLKLPLNVPFSEEKMSWAFKIPDGIDVLKLWTEKKLLGQNVRLAILDSGIATNIRDIYDAIKDKRNDIKSFVPNTTIEDDIGHGTACASIAASRGEKIFGTAPLCDLIIGKIRNASQNITPETVLRGLEWACEERSADVISLSFSWNIVHQDICSYISKQSKPPFNRIFVAAVNNTGSVLKDKKISPANCPGTISVGAYTSNRIACPTSGWNPDLFFSSPGDKLKVYSTEGITIEKTCQTSFACPFTAGVIACIISFYKQNKQPYAASDILQTLASSECLDSIANYNPLVHGKGIINPINIINKINQS